MRYTTPTRAVTMSLHSRHSYGRVLNGAYSGPSLLCGKAGGRASSRSDLCAGCVAACVACSTWCAAIIVGRISFPPVRQAILAGFAGCPRSGGERIAGPECEGVVLALTTSRWLLTVLTVSVTHTATP